MGRHLYRVFGSALLLGLSGAVFAQTENADAAKDAISASDTVFIQNAATDGMAEVRMGKMALSKSSNKKVKALAQQIVDDHTQADGALKALADSKKVGFPSEITKDALKQSDKLDAMKGNAFDEAWSKAMVTDHQSAIKIFAKEAQHTKDTDIQQFVKTTSPTLKSHLDAAQKLAEVPDARDEAMDSATKSMNSAMDSTPAATSTVVAPAVKAPTPVIAPTTAPVAPGAKH